MDPTNCLDIIEQLRYDRDKYIGMWRRQCNIAEEVIRERDRLTAELAEARETRNALADFGQTYKKLTDLLCRIHRDGGQAIGKYGVDKAYVDAVEIVLQTFDRAEKAESELSRYKQGVEMDGEVRCILLAKSEGTCGKAQIIIPIIPIDDSILIGNRVRVLVMPMEDKNE